MPRFTSEGSSRYTLDMINEIDRIASLAYAKKEGREEGRKEVMEETAKKMKEDGIPVEAISKYTGVPLERIAEL